MRLPSYAALPFVALLSLPAMAEVPLVVTDIPPVHALVAQVMGDLGTPFLLLDPGAEEHDFQLRPSQMQAIQDAGLIVWIGPELTPWLERATEGASGPMLSLLDLGQTVQQPYLEDLHAEDAGHEEKGHDHAGNDPHAWLNPDNAQVWLVAIAQSLSQADPGNAATYAANAAAAQGQIAALTDQIAAKLAPVQAQPFMTFHNAYGHFITRFGLTFAGSIADGEAALPGAAHLSELQNRLATEQIACLFPEAQHDAALAGQLLAGTATRLGAALDPVGSTQAPGPAAYGALLMGLADDLAACLKG